MSCPNVICGSTWDRRPWSRSKPRRHSSSITALSSSARRPGPHPIRRRRQLGSTSASNCITSRLLLPDACSTSSRRASRVQHRRPASARRPRRRRAVLRLSASPEPGPARRATRRPFLLALLPVEGVLQLRGRVQRHRAILQALPHALDLRAEPHRLDAPPRCGVAVTQLAHRVIEQAREPAPQIQAPLLNLAQVVDDDHFEMVFDAGKFLGSLSKRSSERADTVVVTAPSEACLFMI